MLEAEYLFARQLMPDFLTGRGPTKWDFRDPERIGREIADGFASYLRSGNEPPADVDVSWVFALPDELPEAAAGSLERLPDELAVSYSMVGQAALQYLQDLVPERRLPGLATRTGTMTHAERAQLRRAAAAVEDPIGRLAAPEYLSVDGVAAIAAVYPEMYQAAVLALGEAISALKRPLRAREEAALGRLSGVAARPMAALKGPDQTGNPDQARPRGKAPQEPDLKPGSQRLTER
jgi:hypothetical protein